jgi:hypothetical protein
MKNRAEKYPPLFLLLLAKFKEIDFNSESFACQIKGFQRVPHPLQVMDAFRYSFKKTVYMYVWLLRK